MLHALHIRNLALIEHAEVRLGTGFHVVSGQTGGGKTLLVTALELLRGGKAGARLVRHGAEELRIDGEFRLGKGERSEAVRRVVAERTGEELEDDLLLVTRIVDARGRSRVRIGGRPATLQALREVGAHLLEIHGQGESRALMRPEIQAETLDGFLGTVGLRRRFAAALAEARAARRRLDEVRERERERRSRLEFLRFQRQEMEAVGIEEGELARLEAEHRVLAHLDRLRGGLQEALAALQEDDRNASQLLARAGRSLVDAAGIDRGLEPAAEGIEEAGERVGEAVRTIQSAMGRLDLDPARLQAVEERLAEVRRVLERYGPGEEDFHATRAKVAAELEELETGLDPAALEEEAAAARALAARHGRKLVRARRKGAEAFTAAVQAELAALDMGAAVLRAAVPDVDEEALLDGATSHGPGPVDFEVRINPGEPFHSLRATASGGELARIVLAIKKTLADQDRVPLLVLDEIDAEIGGRLGLQVGRVLDAVARHHQVVMVTHLPQVAAFAERHLLVRKHTDAGRTRAEVTTLDPAGVEAELAAMAAGEGADENAVVEARRLVERARRHRHRGVDA